MGSSKKTLVLWVLLILIFWAVYQVISHEQSPSTHVQSSEILAMAEAGWAVAPGAPFRLRSGPAVRLTTSRLDPERAPAVAAALDAALAAGAGRQG